MTDQHCYTDDDGCRVCDAVPSTPGTPAHYESAPLVGWDAGANSADTLDGNLRLTWRLPEAPTDAVLGLREASQRGVADTNPVGMRHGFRFMSVAGAQMVVVWERGAELGARMPYSLDDVFEIVRVDGTIFYRINDIEVFRNANAVTGPLIATGCLFRSGDALPSGCADVVDGGGGGGGDDVDGIELTSGVPYAFDTITQTIGEDYFNSPTAFYIAVGAGAESLSVTLTGVADSNPNYVMLGVQAGSSLRNTIVEDTDFDACTTANGGVFTTGDALFYGEPDTCATGWTLTVPVDGAATYYINFDSYGHDETGSFTITATVT